ncbi:MAG: T9SS type A sorting domain-containing protein, partial [Fibromonadales bacterium]|nr:T9SS type A sorting domain-containing protein [Fibromonadales bacterium]
WWYGYAWDNVGTEAHIYQKKGEGFDAYDEKGAIEGGAVDNEYGLQVRMVAKSNALFGAGAGFAFNWKEENNLQLPEDISEFGGLCVSYNLTGDSAYIQLGWDYDAYGYNTYRVKLAPGNHTIDFPWGVFAQDWFEPESGTMKDAIEKALFLNFDIASFNGAEKQTQFTLRQLGTLGACSEAPPSSVEYAGATALPEPATLFAGGLLWSAESEALKLNVPEDFATVEWNAFGGNGVHTADSLLSLLTEQGLQVRLNPSSGSSAGVGFDWGAEKNISAFDGLCLAYHSTGSPLELELKSDSSTYIYALPVGSQSVNIPWNRFARESGISSLKTVIENNIGISIRLAGDGVKESQFTLFEFGSLNKCESNPQVANYDGDLKIPEPLPTGGLLWSFERARRETDNLVYAPQYDSPWLVGDGNVFQRTEIQEEKLVANDNTHGMQVRLNVDGGNILEPSEASFKFNWRESGSENISAFNGLCIAYSLTGSPVEIEIGSLTYTLQAGSNALEIPWSRFTQTGGTNRQTVLAEAENLKIRLQNTLPGSKQAQFTLNELGSIGSCSGEIPATPLYAGGLEPPKPENGILWDYRWSSNDDDVKIFANGAKENTDGEWYDLSFGKNGRGFNWDIDASRDINDFEGLCLVYNLQEAGGLKVGLAWDDEYGHGVFYKTLASGSHAVNIPWSEFEKDFGPTRKAMALEQSMGLSFEYASGADFSLVQLGKLGACTAIPDTESKRSPVPPDYIPAPMFADADAGIDENKISEIKPVLQMSNSLKLSPARNGVNVFSQTSGAKLFVYNVNGRVAMRIDNLKAGESFVSLSNLRSGVYVLRLSNGSEIQTIKFNK